MLLLNLSLIFSLLLIPMNCSIAVTDNHDLTVDTYDTLHYEVSVNTPINGKYRLVLGRGNGDLIPTVFLNTQQLVLSPGTYKYVVTDSFYVNNTFSFGMPVNVLFENTDTGEYTRCISYIPVSAYRVTYLPILIK